MNLKHYGVKGMKWGVRRSEEELSEGSESSGGGLIEETEGIIDEFSNFIEDKIEEFKDVKKSVFDGFKKKGEELAEKYKRYKNPPIDYSKFKPAKLKKLNLGPAGQEEFERFAGEKRKLDNRLKKGKISKKEYNRLQEKNRNEMKRNVKLIERYNGMKTVAVFSGEDRVK